MKFKWNPTLYNDQHDYVHNFGDEVVTLLDPQKDDVILDLGCGTGDLTKRISSSCKEVIGLDSSLEMIQVAGRKYHEISFYHMEAKDLDLNIAFDAVFSNAVLHWIIEPEIIIQNINRHLKMGGRFVAEFGGKGCVKKIISTLTDILDSKKVIYPAIGETLYYPSISEYSRLLERNGFEVSLAMLFDRPTELKGGLDGLKNFIEMFFNWLFENVSEQEKMEYIATVEKRLKDELLHDSTWIADYRRIRILAIKTNHY
ncbi:MAG: class I SAM-dependent methyltransferase [Desulfocapsaceae bacterium]